MAVAAASTFASPVLDCRQPEAYRGQPVVRQIPAAIAAGDRSRGGPDHVRESAQRPRIAERGPGKDEGSAYLWSD